MLNKMLGVTYAGSAHRSKILVQASANVKVSPKSSKFFESYIMSAEDNEL